VSDSHVRLLRGVAALRRQRGRIRATPAPAEGTPERLDQLTDASIRADAELTAATNRGRQGSDDHTPSAEGD
jgi:hypothetical protein